MAGELQKAFRLVARKLQEARALSNDDTYTRLQCVIEEHYEGTGQWYVHVVDVFGNQSSGYVVYALGDDLMKAGYSLGTADGKATCAVDCAGAVKVFPRTTYEVAGGDPSSTEVTEALKLVESAAWEEELPLQEAAKSDYAVKLIAPGKGSTAFYPAEVLQRDGPTVFKAGTHMYWNHPTDAEEAARPDGNLDHLAGVLTSDAYYSESGRQGAGLYARAKVFADYAAKLEERAEHIGLSIRASGTAEPGQMREGRPVLKSFTHAESTDFVTRAGAGGLVLTESARAENTKGGESAMDQAEITKLQESVRLSNEAVRKSNQRLALFEARAMASTEIAKIRLPEATRQRLVSRAVAMAPIDAEGALNADAFKAIIAAEAEDEAEYLARLTEGRVVTGMGPAAEATPPDPAKQKEAFAGAMDELGAALGLSESGRKAFVGVQ